MEESQKIELYILNPIMDEDSCLEMANELKAKLEEDKKILEKNNDKDNITIYNTNLYTYYFLRFDYYCIKSCSSTIDNKDIESGWFIWLKNFNLNSNIDFKSIDEKYTYFYERYFDFFFELLKNKNDYIDEAIWCFKNAKYHGCACLLFTSIENVERSISQFDPKQLFSMSKEIHKHQSSNVEAFNHDYFNNFEEKMNKFLSNNYYATSVASDPEPRIINRNRIMHGIFTRKVDKIDCLKLFVLLNTMIQFNDWLESYRQIQRLSQNINVDD